VKKGERNETHESWTSVWTRPTSRTRLTLGLNIVIQSLPSFLRSLGAVSGSKLVTSTGLSSLAASGGCCCAGVEARDWALEAAAMAGTADAEGGRGEGCWRGGPPRGPVEGGRDPG